MIDIQRADYVKAGGNRADVQASLLMKSCLPSLGNYLHLYEAFMLGPLLMLAIAATVPGRLSRS